MEGRSPDARALLGFIIAVALLGALGFAASQAAVPSMWHPVRPTVPVGEKVRVELRLMGPDHQPITGAISVTSVRLDMGPDGMAGMTSPIHPAHAHEPGLVAFEGDFTMAGRWAITVTANVSGVAEPFTGTAIVTAEEPKPAAGPVVESPQAAAPAPAERRVLYYRNPMGLPDISPVPKKDSMGMDYVPVYADEAGPAGAVRIAPQKVQLAGVRLATVERVELTRTVRGFGTIAADESRLAVVTPKFNGFVEELAVPVTGAHVAAGDPLLRVWIESPEILQREADFITALDPRTGSRAAAELAERTLRRFGFGDEALGEMRLTRTAMRSISLRAPRDGTVIEKPAMVGMRFAAGDVLFRTVDLSVVWALTEIAERDLAHVMVGQDATVTLQAIPDRPLAGRVAFIYPELNRETRTAMVRIELANPDGSLRLGQYADVAIAATADGPRLAIPQSALIDDGSRQVALVSLGEGLFEPRPLLLGARAGGLVEVREGLAEGDRIVVAGNFLVDAESNLQAALAAFLPPPEVAP